MGSIPTARVNNYGGCGEVVNTPDCGSGMRGFDPHHSPIYYLHYWGIAKHLLGRVAQMVRAHA